VRIYPPEYVSEEEEEGVDFVLFFLLSEDSFSIFVEGFKSSLIITALINPWKKKLMKTKTTNFLNISNSHGANSFGFLHRRKR
jgi:hypothetical protein